MVSDRTRKLAKAKGLGIEGYRQMTDAQLDTAIAKASKPAKGKTATARVSASPAKGKTASTAKGKTAAKGKMATAPAAKSTARKSSPRATAAEGKATRQSATPAKRTTTRKPAAKPVAKAPVKRTTAKAAPANGTRRAPISKDKGTRNFLDIKGIDWKAESTVGLNGKRKDVLDALRRFKGNYDKVFDLLAPKAKVYYKGKTKIEAEKLLRWLIARVAFDFAVNTDQHEMGARREYGTANGSSTKPTARKAVKTATKPAATRKPATARKPAAKPKATPAARKPAQRRTAAPAAKRGGKVTAGRR